MKSTNVHDFTQLLQAIKNLKKKIFSLAVSLSGPFIDIGAPPRWKKSDMRVAPLHPVEPNIYRYRSLCHAKAYRCIKLQGAKRLFRLRGWQKPSEGCLVHVETHSITRLYTRWYETNMNRNTHSVLQETPAKKIVVLSFYKEAKKALRAGI